MCTYTISKAGGREHGSGTESFSRRYTLAVWGDTNHVATRVKGIAVSRVRRVAPAGSCQLALNRANHDFRRYRSTIECEIATKEVRNYAY